MLRRLGLTAVILGVCSLAASATAWEEIGAAATVVTDHATGLPALIFTAGLAYDETPAQIRLSTRWQVFSVQSGAETMLYEYSKITTLRNPAKRIYSASQPVLIQPDRQYGARVWIDDPVNALSFRRSYFYLVPQAIPVGIRLVGGDGAEAADLASMPDLELEELVFLKRRLAGYEVLAKNVSIEGFFSQHAISVAQFPCAVILLPDTGVNNNWGTESQPITVTFGLTVLAFSVSSPGVSSAFQEQLAQYDQPFSGTVYVGTSDDGLGRGVLVFVHDAMDLILDEAAAEWAARSM